MTMRSLLPWRRQERRRQEGSEEEYGLDRFFGGTGMMPATWEGFSPRVDIAETEEEVRVSVELPGMDEEEIDVSVTRDTLTISGEKRSETEKRGENYYRMERSYGSFRRSVPLPTEVNADEAKARYQRGVLTVELPKTEEARQRKRIEVKSE